MRKLKMLKENMRTSDREKKKEEFTVIYSHNLSIFIFFCLTHFLCRKFVIEHGHDVDFEW